MGGAQRETGIVIHETPRLFLESWALEDFEPFAAIARDARVMRYIAEGDPWPDSRIGWFMGKQSALQETLGFCNWKLTDRASGELIGLCGLAPLQPMDDIEVGWWLRPEYWRRGYAFEAAECVVSAAFKVYGLSRIVARVYRTNTRSVALIERLGMVFDHVLDTKALGEVALFSLNNPNR